MRRPIHTVPKDGTGLILHDELTGRCELVRWSPDQNVWVSPDGQSCDINASCWYPLRANRPHSTQGVDSMAEQRDELAARTTDLPRAVPSPPVQPAEEQYSEESTLCMPTSRTEVSAAPVRADDRTADPGVRRRKLVLGIAMIVASCAGAYFRPEVVAWTSRPAEQKAVMLVSSSEPPTPTHASDLSHAANNSQPNEHRLEAPAPTLLDSHEDFDKQSAQWRQELAESHRREELQKESAAELRRSLEEAQVKISRLESQLSFAKQTEKTTVSRKQTRRAERQNRNRAPRTFFGEFGSARSP
jgi:hypothetical protein